MSAVSFLLFLGLLNLEAGGRNGHPEAVVSRVSHLDDVADDGDAFGRFPHLLELLLADVRREVYHQGLYLREGLHLVQEVVGKSLQIVALHETQSWAAFEELVELVGDIGESSNFQTLQKLKPFKGLAFDLVAVDQVIDPLVAD